MLDRPPFRGHALTWSLQSRRALGRKTVAVVGDGGRGERARVRSAASPEGRAKLRTRARRARSTPRAPLSGRCQSVTRSGGRDEREVMVALGLLGGAVAERGMQTAAVVELLDVLEDRAARLLVRGIRPPAQSLFLQ